MYHRFKSPPRLHCSSRRNPEGSSWNYCTLGPGSISTDLTPDFTLILKGPGGITTHPLWRRSIQGSCYISWRCSPTSRCPRSVRRISAAPIQQRPRTTRPYSIWPNVLAKPNLVVLANWRSSLCSVTSSTLTHIREIRLLAWSVCATLRRASCSEYCHVLTNSTQSVSTSGSDPTEPALSAEAMHRITSLIMKIKVITIILNLTLPMKF